jgi:acetyl esterase/lipase
MATTVDYIKYALLRTFINTRLSIIRSTWYSPTTQPDSTKVYPCRPNLFPCRIFQPRLQAPVLDKNDRRSLPLVIRVHGGGFILNNPSIDDPLSRHLADNAECMVVSIDYGKAPQTKLREAREDVVEQCLAILSDHDLSIDHRKVVLCGSSAGGYLVLSAVQDPRLRDRIKGVATIYPLVDLSTSGEEKMATRPDASVPDFIGAQTYGALEKLLFDPAAGEPDKRDSILSPTFFRSRSSLPEEVLMIGAEHDMFCREAEVMAGKLAAGAERIRDEKKGWKAERVRWHVVQGQKHGFEFFPEKDGDKERERTAKVAEMYAVLVEWLGPIFGRDEVRE